MKIRYFLYLSLFLVASCNAPKSSLVNPTEFEGIKKIKSLVYEASGDGQQFVKNQLTTQYEYQKNEVVAFDPSGHLIKESTLGLNQSVISEKGYRYNAKTDQLELIYEILASADSVKYTYTYKLNAYPKTRQKRMLDEILVSTDYLYDAQNRLVQEKSFDLSSTEYYTINYEYPSDTKTIESHFGDNNNLIKKIITTLSDNGQTVETTTYDKKNKPVQTLTLYHDLNEQLVRKTLYIYEGEAFTDISITYNAQSLPSERVTYKSTEQGFHTYKYQYQYNSKADWIQQTVTLDDQPAYIIQRTMEYYAPRQ